MINLMEQVVRMEGVRNCSGSRSVAGFSIIQATILNTEAADSSERVYTKRCQETEYRSLKIRYRENLNHHARTTEKCKMYQSSGVHSHCQSAAKGSPSLSQHTDA